MEVGYLFSFSAGVLSVVSPCVLPLIPLVIGHSISRRNLKDVLMFIAGFYLVFAILTILTVLFTAAINYYIFYFRIIASLLLIVFGIAILFNKNIFNFNIKNKHQNEGNGSFFVGFLTSLAWSPCYGPYVVAVAAFSVATGNWIYSVLNMILFTAGFSITLTLIAVITSKISLEIFTNHYNKMRTLSGIIIIAAGIYLLIGYIGL